MTKGIIGQLAMALNAAKPLTPERVYSVLKNFFGDSLQKLAVTSIPKCVSPLGEYGCFSLNDEVWVVTIDHNYLHVYLLDGGSYETNTFGV